MVTHIEWSLNWNVQSIKKIIFTEHLKLFTKMVCVSVLSGNFVISDLFDECRRL